jgi:hypothetical protein
MIDAYYRYIVIAIAVGESQSLGGVMNAVFKEAVGQNYSIDAMRHAQEMTWRAIAKLAELIQPGMLESQARELGKQVLVDLEMQRIWHPLLVRFGANTLKTFKQRSDGDPCLGENDIYFIDMGAVWQGHEGDAGVRASGQSLVRLGAGALEKSPGRRA